MVNLPRLLVAEVPERLLTAALRPYPSKEVAG
jgi:hypothetical protein